MPRGIYSIIEKKKLLFFLEFKHDWIVQQALSACQGYFILTGRWRTGVKLHGNGAWNYFPVHKIAFT